MRQLNRFCSEADMLHLLAAAGFSGERGAKNIGYNQAWMAFVARPGLPKPDLNPAPGSFRGQSEHDRAD
jgi:hypothetical protein